MLRNRVLVRIVLTLLVVALTASAVPPSASRAQANRMQDNSIIVTVGLPNFIANNITEKVYADFEAENPGVKFQIVDVNTGLPDAALALDEHYKELDKFVAAADVLLIDPNRISPEATLAGYYLDLAPLVAEDTTLNSDDYYPAAWQSYQWDKGIWALPFSLEPYVFIYEPKAFDDAGLAYPSEQWTLDDIVNAAKQLVQKDADGKVTRAGIDLFSPRADAFLFRSLLGQSLFDTSVVPYAPTLVNPTVETILTTWQELEADGTIGRSFNEAPMSVAPAFALIFPALDPGQEPVKRSGLLLPGGAAGVDVNAFAISGGTQHPKEAYAVAKFLTTRPEVTSGGVPGSPARRSLVGQSSGEGFQLNVPEDVQAVIDRSLEVAIPVADLRFLNYVSAGYNKMKTDQIDAKTALQEAEVNAQQNQQGAVDKKANLVINVAPPVENVTVTADGRVALKFALASFFQGGDLPNKDEWDRVIADFVAGDAQVGAVEIKQGFDQVDKLAEKNDCIYLPFNAVPNADLGTILALDPFIDADATFDKNDVIADVLTQLTREGKVWAYPFVIEPSILKYNGEAFNSAGAVAPTAGWTIDEFNDAVRTLKINPEDPAPFADNGTGGVYLLVLTAAYGGLPLDFRTDPPTIAYTDPANVEAIRQTLNLAKDKYIKYTRLASFLGGGLFGGGNAEQPTITTANLNAFGFNFGPPTGGASNGEDPYRSTTYPRGTTFTGASYSIGIGLISATSQSPEGCYRFFNTIGGNAKLFNAMPARRSLINNASGAQSADLVALYNELDALLADPNTIIFPSQFSGGASPTGFLLQYWLYQAFDRYVLEDKDLETELATSEQMSKDFQACAGPIPLPDFGDQQATRDYIKAFGKCATDVDPTLAPFFALIR
jgi:ABC-type glycerol-3-phosphate transport system substrate-binding protein